MQGTAKKERRYTYTHIWLTHFVVQHGKAVIPPVKKNQLINVTVYFWTPGFDSFMSVLMPILYCLEVTYCSFVLSYAIGKSSSFFLFSRFVLAVLDLLNFHIDFRIGLSVFSKRELEF